MSAITAKASRKMKKYAVLTREPRCFLGSFDFSWEQRKLSEITDKVTEKNAGLQYVETFTNSAEFGIISQRDFFDHDIAKLGSLDGYYIVKNEDFVYNPRISTSAPVGPINRNKLGRTGVMSPLYTVFRPHDIDTTYLEYFFKCGYWHSFMNFNGDSGARSDRFSIRDNVFFQMPIPIPDIDEQRKIGELLTCLDNLITLHQRKCANLCSPSQVVFSLLFATSTFSWEQRKLGEMGQTYTGLSGKTKDDFGHGQARFVTYMNVFSNPISNPEMTEPIEIDPKQNEVEVGDVFFTTSSETPEEVGMSSILLEKRGKTYLNSFCFGFRPSEKIDSYYLAYMLRSESTRAKIILLAQGISRYNISKNKVMEIAVSLPSLDEQKMIGQYFSQLDNLITLHQRECISFTGRADRLILTANKKRTTSSWEQRKLGDIASDMVAGGDIDKDLILAEGQYPVIANALTGDGIVGYYDKEYRVNAPAVTVTGRGDVGHAKARLVNFTPVVRLLSVKSEHDVFFLENAINTLKIVIESTGVPQLTVPQLAKYEVAFPRQLDEEEHIGAFFKQLDHLITLHQRKFEKLTNVKKSMLEKMFPQNGSSYPEIRFKGFTDPWEQRKLGEIGSVSMCRRIFKEQTSETGDIPFYKIGTFGADPDAFISRELFEEYKSKYPYPQKGDILISASGSIGRTVEFAGNNEYFQDSNIVWLNHDERLSNPFLKCFYSVVKWAGIEGSTIKRLYNDNILNTVICMPSVPEQKRIGLFFENLDNLITLHQRELEKLQNIKKSMLEKMFV